VSKMVLNEMGIDEVINALKAMHHALEFYADSSNYRAAAGHIVVIDDAGEQARTALRKIGRAQCTRTAAAVNWAHGRSHSSFRPIWLWHGTKPSNPLFPQQPGFGQLR